MRTILRTVCGRLCGRSGGLAVRVTHTRMNARTQTCIHERKHAHMHTHMHSRTQTRTNMHMHMHTNNFGEVLGWISYASHWYLTSSRHSSHLWAGEDNGKLCERTITCCGCSSRPPRRSGHQHPQVHRRQHQACLPLACRRHLRRGRPSS